MHLIPRLGNLRDGAHQRLTRVGQGAFVAADFVRFFLTIALELVGNFAKAIALGASVLEVRRFLIESHLLLCSLVSNIGGLSASDFYASSQISEARFRLLQERSQALDVACERCDLFANRRCARRAL